MEERKIIESENYCYQKKLKKRFCLCVVLLGVCILLYNATLNKLTSLAVRTDGFKDELSLIENAILSTLRAVHNVSHFLAIGLGVISVALIVFYLFSAKTKIIVTDKRVYGKTAFGKQVDLILDNISLVEKSAFQGLAVVTSSSNVKFLGISNRDEIYETIKKILADGESKEVEVTEPVTNVTQAQSSADELKKFKELLDSGIITQEEFDAKKKQLLGL